MDDLLFSLVLLGVIAIITFAVLIPIKLILKKGISVKKSLGFMGISFVVAITSLMLTPTYESDKAGSVDEPTESNSEASPNKEDDATEGEVDKNEESKEKNDYTELDAENIKLNVYEVADKEKEKVEDILGEGEKVSDNTFNNSWYTDEPAETYSYNNENIEIYYIENIAARITIRPTKDIPFDDEESRELFLRKYGFPFWANSKEGPMGIYWKDFGSITDGLDEVTMFKDDDGNINYVFVVTQENFYF